MPTSPFVVAPPIEPMLAKLATELPAGDAFLYEPKWDGFRAIVFRGATEVFIQSRDLRPLDRYFPELHDALLAGLPDGCVVDGEIVIATPRGLDFDALAAAAASRRLARREAREGDARRVRRVRRDRRRRTGPARLAPRASAALRLERLLANVKPPIHLTPMTRDRGPGVRVAVAVRRRGPRRRDREARRRDVPARQARDDQGEARAHRRLRRRRLSLAQGGKGRARRLAAARAVRRQAAGCITSA